MTSPGARPVTARPQRSETEASSTTFVARNRATLVVAVPVIALLLVASVLERLSAPAPSGPQGSAFATAPSGVAAWATLLERSDTTVVLRRAPLDAGPTSELSSPALDPSVTLVVLDQDINESEVDALRTFVARGGRLVAGGPGCDGWIERIAGVTYSGDPRGRADDPREVTVVDPRRWREARRLSGMGTATWRPVEGAEVIATDATGPVAIAVAATDTSGETSGNGTVIALADISVVANAYLADADNAAFALALGGGRPVHFAEAGHGYGLGRLGAGLPPGARPALMILAFAGLLLLLARSRRNGPAEQAARDLPPSTRTYVDSLAAALARRRRRPPAPPPTQPANTSTPAPTTHPPTKPTEVLR